MTDNLRVPPDLRRLARQARAAGWTITALGSGHLAWRAPSGALVTTTSATPGGSREPRALRARLRRAGPLCS